MENNYNYYSPAMLNIDGTLITVSCRAKAGRNWGFIQLICERQNAAGGESETAVICSPPARVINDNENNTKSAFFLAPSITVAENGDIILLATLFPESKGAGDLKLLEKKKISCAYHDGKRYPLIYDRDGNFFYVLDDGSVLDKLKKPTDYTVKPLGELYKGEEYIGNIYLNGAKGKPDEVNKTTHGAPLKAPKRSYLMLFRSVDGGKTWSEPKDITPYVLNDKDSACLTTVAGTALTTENGRLIFPLKSEKENICIYSDDGGETWCRNQRRPFTGTKGDWLVFETPNHHLYDFASNKGKLTAAMSADNGIIWMKGDKPKLKTGANAMGALVLDDKILIAHSSPKSGECGAIAIGDYILDKRGGFKGISWRRDDAPLDEPIGSSSLAEIDNETIAIAYEDAENSDIKIQFIKMK